MRILLGELRKVFWLRNVVIAAIIGVLYYWAFAWPHVELFPNGNPATEIHDITVALRHEFGPTLEPDEVAVVRARRDDMVTDADAIISASPLFRAAGVSTWDELRQVEELTPELSEAQWSTLFTHGGLGWMIEATESIIDQYGPRPTTSTTTAAEAARIRQINDGAEWRSLQSPVLLEFLSTYPAPLGTLVFMTVLLVTGPLVTSDHVSRVRPLQATSRTGSRVALYQLAATVVASLIVTLAVLALTAIPLGRLDVEVFWNNPLASFAAAGVYPALTLGQQCLTVAALLTLIGVSAGLLGFSLSSLSRTHPALALGIVGALAAGMAVLPLSVGGSFSYDSLPALLSGYWLAPLLVWSALAVLLAAVALATSRSLNHLP